MKSVIEFQPVFKKQNELPIALGTTVFVLLLTAKKCLTLPFGYWTRKICGLNAA
jgi:hypothetical protein